MRNIASARVALAAIVIAAASSMSTASYAQFAGGANQTDSIGGNGDNKQSTSGPAINSTAATELDQSVDQLQDMATTGSIGDATTACPDGSTNCAQPSDAGAAGGTGEQNTSN